MTDGYYLFALRKRLVNNMKPLCNPFKHGCVVLVHDDVTVSYCIQNGSSVKTLIEKKGVTARTNSSG